MAAQTLKKLNRTAKLKIAYFGSTAVALFLGVGIAIGFRFHPVALVCAAALLFLPGRVTGYFWRELIAARRLMDSSRHAEALPLLEGFVRKLETSPWLERLIWIAPSIYTVRAKAMALNNQGACHLETGELDLAEGEFSQALQLDSLYPIPHYNLAVIEMVRGNETQSQQHLKTSHDLGFSGGSIDQALNRVKTAYAKGEPAARIGSEPQK